MSATKDEKSGAWISRFYYTDYHGERKRAFKRGFKTKKEALEWEREFIAKSENSVEMSFQSLYEIYIEDLSHRIKETTLNLRQGIFKVTILPFFSKLKVNEIEATTIRKFQNQLLASGKNYSPTYLKLINTTLSSVFNYAVSFHKLDNNPCKKAGSIGKLKSPEMNIWTYEEFLKFSEKSKVNIEAYTAFNLLFWTGMRIGEMLALTMKDINLEQKTININKTFSKIRGKEIITPPKTEGSIRIVPVSIQLIEILREYFKKFYEPNEDTKIFYYNHTHYRRLLKKYAEESEIRKIRIHDLRHSHASLLIHLGVNPLLISKRLGHEKVDITLNTYSHLYPDSSEKMIALLEEL